MQLPTPQNARCGLALLWSGDGSFELGEEWPRTCCLNQRNPEREIYVERKCRREDGPRLRVAWGKSGPRGGPAALEQRGRQLRSCRRRLGDRALERVPCSPQGLVPEPQRGAARGGRGRQKASRIPLDREAPFGYLRSGDRGQSDQGTTIAVRTSLALRFPASLMALQSTW